MAQSQGNAVVMKDGRTVVFGSRMKSKKEVISDNEVRFDYANGSTVIFDTRKVSADTLRLLALHGAKQKIGDEGSDADSADEYEAVGRAMIDRLYGGTAFDRQGGGGFQDTVLIEALLDIGATNEDGTVATREQVVAILKGMAAAEKLALRQIAEVADAIARIEAKKSEGVDAGAIAAKFGLKK